MATKTPNTPKTPDPIDTKIEDWWKKMWTWLARVISWACGTLCNTLSASYHLVWAWVSKIQEGFTDKKDKKLVASRKNITDSHLKKVKSSGQKAVKHTKNTITWTYDTVAWTTKVTINSVKKAAKSVNNPD